MEYTELGKQTMLGTAEGLYGYMPHDRNPEIVLFLERPQKFGLSTVTPGYLFISS